MGSTILKIAVRDERTVGSTPALSATQLHNKRIRPYVFSWNMSVRMDVDKSESYIFVRQNDGVVATM